MGEAFDGPLLALLLCHQRLRVRHHTRLGTADTRIFAEKIAWSERPSSFFPILKHRLYGLESLDVFAATAFLKGGRGELVRDLNGERQPATEGGIAR